MGLSLSPELRAKVLRLNTTVKPGYGMSADSPKLPALRTKTKPDINPTQTKRLNQLEKRFIMLWAECGGPPFVLEHRFCPTRRWRFDFACIDAKVAIEIEGGIWTRGRHTRGFGYAADCMKYNTATAMGWRVFRLTSENLKDIGAVRMIVDTLRKAV